MILIPIFLLILYVVLCSKIEVIADLKGYKGYFWWSLFFSPLIGLLMVIALPDRNIIKK